MQLKYVILLLVVLFIPSDSSAVLPPDIIFSIGTQLWQIVVGAGALVVGALVAIFSFLSNVLLRIPKSRVIILSFGLSAMFFGFGYLIFIAATDEWRPRNLVATHDVASTTGHEFHAQRFVLLGKKTNGDPVLINLDLNRKELPKGSFVHYYLGDIVNGKSATSIDVQQNGASREVIPTLFFTQFLRTLPEDHSARESYLLAFTAGGHEYQIETDMITSDFLIKNEPEYTAYIGAGKAQGVVDGEEIEFQAMIQRIYSTDYRPTIFFDPEGKLPSESVQMVLWDMLGNFYLIDRSRVEGDSPAYATHFWGLYKSKEGVTRRVFGDGAAMAMYQDEHADFTARFGHGDDVSSILLHLAQTFNGKADEGYVDGSVTDALGSRNIYGYGYHHMYGPKQ